MGIIEYLTRRRPDFRMKWQPITAMNFRSQVVILILTNLCLIIPVLVGIQLVRRVLKIDFMEVLSLITTSLSSPNADFEELANTLLAKTDASISSYALVYFATFFAFMGILSFYVNAWIMFQWLKRGKEGRKEE